MEKKQSKRVFSCLLLLLLAIQMMAQGNKGASGFGLSSGVPLVNDSAGTAAGGVLGGLANANNGMSYEALPPQWMDSLSNGWDALKGMFSFGA